MGKKPRRKSYSDFVPSRYYDLQLHPEPSTGEMAGETGKAGKGKS
jgi:hypothetical protein